MMKKFTLLLAFSMLFSLGMMAQNLIENAGFEDWTGDVLDSWVVDGDAITVTQNTTEVHEGSSSCHVLFTSDANQNLKSNTFAVAAGEPIAVSVYVFDNDAAGRARLSILFEGGDNYYGNEYSEDMDSWQLLSYTGLVPDGATQATFQVRFYDVAANWDGNCEIIVDESSFIIDDEIKPEPTNYPTEFAAAVNGVAASITWVDAVGDQLPSKYLVLASSSDDFSLPVDGTEVADDTDISDGSAALNISFGNQAASFAGLTAGETYYFTIYPYTNSGADIDFKTDGTAPTAQLTMPDITLISSIDFEDDTFGDWTPISVIGDLDWYVMEYNTAKFAVMSGYDGAPLDNEDWIISPAFNTSIYDDVEFSFDNAMSYSGPDLQVFLSQDYDGSSDPNGFTWVELTEEFTFSGGSFEWISSGSLNLDIYSHQTLYLAFKYTSTTDGAAKWEVDNLLVTGVPASGVNDMQNNTIHVYPNPSNGIYQIENLQQQSLEIAVYNLLGEQVTETFKTSSHYTLDISDLENGVYFLQIISNNQRKTISLIKK